MLTYNKLFAKILDSSIWLEPTPTRIVWLTFIAVMDEDGFVQFASIANVAHRARVAMDEAAEAIRCLEQPDPNSSDPDNDGRRIERVPGGWMVLNAEKHREMVTRAVIKEHTRERVKRHRAKKLAESNASVTPCNAPKRNVTQSVSVAIAVSEADPDVRTRVRADGFDAFWMAYPRKTGKGAAQRIWQRLHPDASLQARILAAIGQQRCSEQWCKDGGQFIPHPSTWLNQQRWDDEPVQVPNLNDTTVQTLAAGERWLARRQQRQEVLDVHK